jgi:hypothetical protein
MKCSSSNPPSRQLNLLRLSDLACQEPGLVGSKSAILASLFQFSRGLYPQEWPCRLHKPNFSRASRDAQTSQTLLAALGEHGPTLETRYAVRSSALDEDSADYSFAGQYETALGLSSV